jgi:hypothetical protein
LKLRGEAAKVFQLLVFQEEQDLDPKKRTSAKLRDELNHAKHQLRCKTESHTVEGDANGLYHHIHWPRIYAALGDSSGSTLDEIISRTKLPLKTVVDTLEALVKENVAKICNQNYVAQHESLNFINLGQSDFFKKHLGKK